MRWSPLVSSSAPRTAWGWEVEITDGPTPSDIIGQARRFVPQCVLLDIRLGEGVGSGIDLIAPLRATGADVVMLTAETQRMVLAVVSGGRRRRLDRQGRLPRRGRGHPRSASSPASR